MTAVASRRPSSESWRCRSPSTVSSPSRSMRLTVWLTVGPLWCSRSAIRARSGMTPSSSSSRMVRRYISVVSTRSFTGSFPPERRCYPAGRTHWTGDRLADQRSGAGRGAGLARTADRPGHPFPAGPHGRAVRRAGTHPVPGRGGADRPGRRPHPGRGQPARRRADGPGRAPAVRAGAARAVRRRRAGTGPSGRRLLRLGRDRRQHHPRADRGRGTRPRPLRRLLEPLDHRLRPARGPVMTVTVVWTEELLRYNLGDHPLDPVRVELTMALARELGVLNRPGITMCTPEPADDATLSRVHTGGYIAAVRAGGPGYGLDTPDNPVFPGMHEASALVVGATLAAAEDVSSGRSRR